MTPANLAGSLAPLTLAAAAAAQYLPEVLAADRVSGQVYMLLSGPERILRLHARGAALAGPQAMAEDPEDFEFVLVSGAAGVARIEAASGRVLGTLLPPGSGGIARPDDLGSVFRQRQTTFVLDAADGTVRRYATDGGNFLGVAVPPLAEASAMIVNKGVYPNEFFFIVAYPGLNQVRRYDGHTGQFLNVVVPNIPRPRAMLQLASNYWYLAEDNPDPGTPDRVLAFDIAIGVPQPVLTLAPGETARAMGYDYHGHSYVSVGERIDQYDWAWQRVGSWLLPGAEFTAIVPCNTGACYADCDTSEPWPGPLDIFDFVCFQYKYALGEPYACNCDIGTGMDVCDVFDFLCFQNAYAAGCP